MKIPTLKISSILFLLLFLSACSSTKYVVNLTDFKIGIHQLHYSMPLVYLERLKAERTVSDAEGNLKAVRHLRKAVPSVLAPKYAVTVDSVAPAAEYYDDIGRMFLRLDSARDISSVRVGEEWRNHLSRQREQYCVVVELTGFSRSGGGVAMETFKSLMIGVFTLGMVVSVPVKANAALSVAVVDREEGRVIYYDKNVVQGNPTDLGVLDDQLKKVFKTFLK